MDRWLWAVRVAKTRSMATDACRGGHVRVNGRSAKAATPVRAGDRVEARINGRPRILEVVDPIEVRVGAAIAAECVIDHTPPEPRRADVGSVPRRDPGAGRPTKKDRRRLDRARRGSR